MIRRFKQTICLLMKLVVFALCGLAFFIPFGIVVPYVLIPSRTAAITWLSFVIIYYLMTRVYGGFDVGKKKSKPIIFSLSLTVLMTDLVTHLFLCIMNYTVVHQGHFVYESPLLLLLVYIMQVGIIVICAYVGNDLYFSVAKPQKCLVITQEGDSAAGLLKEIGRLKKQYNVVGNAFRNEPVVLEKIDEVDAVFFYNLSESERSPLIEYCYEHQKDVYYSLEIPDIVAMGGTRVLFGDKSMIASPVKGLTFEQRIIKRLSDIVIAGLALVILSPLFLLTAIAIKLEDGGPVFYKQKRATYGGRVFDVIKFRSMRVQDGSVHVSVTKDDDRITKVGHFIRKFRIDELPQLINVLKSDMSMVGPRPEMVENVEKYTRDLPQFEYRLRAKAGLTGMAQIYGKYNTSPKDKLILDITYIEQYSLWLDLKLILRTVLVLLTPEESTEAFDGEEKK